MYSLIIGFGRIKIISNLVFQLNVNFFFLKHVLNVSILMLFGIMKYIEYCRIHV